MTTGKATGYGGVYEKDGKFLTGVTGAMWPRPESDDFTRAGLAGLNWTRLSWSNVDCCQKVNKVKQWEDVRTGVPDCFCRDVLMQSEYKTSSFCMLQQVTGWGMLRFDVMLTVAARRATWSTGGSESDSPAPSVSLTPPRGTSGTQSLLCARACIRLAVRSCQLLVGNDETDRQVAGTSSPAGGRAAGHPGRLANMGESLFEADTSWTNLRIPSGARRHPCKIISHPKCARLCDADGLRMLLTCVRADVREGDCEGGRQRCAQVALGARRSSHHQGRCPSGGTRLEA
eukprot:758760-Hanusia_phi.AAC.5